MRHNLFYSLIITLLFVVSCHSKKNAVKSKQGNIPNLSENLRLDFDRSFYNANKEKMLGNTEQAANLFSNCLRINEKSGAANYELALIYFKQQRMTECNLFSKRAAELEPSNIWYNELYAQVLLSKKEYDKAAIVFKNITKQHPNKREFYDEEASVYLIQNKYESAIEVFDRMEKQFGINEDIINNKRQIYLKQNKLEKAAYEVNKLIKLHPENARYYGMMAEMYMANNQTDKAYDYLKKALVADSNNVQVHLALSDYYRVKKDYDKSYYELKKSFASPDLDVDTKMKVLLSYYSITENNDPKYKQQSNELMQIMKTTHPKDARSYFIAGDFLYRDKKLKEAAVEFEQGLKYDKEKFPAWNQTIIIYSELQDYDNMLRISNEAIELFPNQAPLFLYKGVASMQKKEYKESIKALKQGASITVDNDQMLTSFYMYLGDSYHADNDNKNSDDSYEKALKLEANNIYVLNNYAYYLSERGENLERAAEMSAKTLKLDPTVGNYQDTYAWILYKQKKYTEALEWQQKAMAGASPSAVMQEHLGDIYFKLNETDKAMEYWQMAKGKLGVSTFLDKKITDKKLYE
jgi:tetratricopeptide (TPR) repeat protein